MADNFGLKIGLEGEKEFKKALADINQSFKVLGSEMKVVQSQFDKNDDSVEALTARNQVLGKEIDAQKKKIETLRQALENASTSFGENDRRTQQWQIQLNNAQAALNNNYLPRGVGFFKIKFAHFFSKRQKSAEKHHASSRSIVISPESSPIHSSPETMLPSPYSPAVGSHGVRKMATSPHGS